MTDYDETHKPGAASDSVRIIGAREASEFDARGAKAPEASSSSNPRAEFESSDSSLPNTDAPQPAVWGNEGPSWSATDAGDVPEPTLMLPVVGHGDAEGEVPELPHWSDPPTGQMPAVFTAEASDGDDADADPAFGSTGPRYRSSTDAWTDDDLASALASTEDERDELRVGAMASPKTDVTEDDDAFVAAVRARRRAGTRAVVTSTPERRAPRSEPVGGRRSTTRTGEASEHSDDVLPGTGSGRDLGQAVATGLAFAAVALICFFVGRSLTAPLVAVVLGVCAFELCAALQSKGLRPATVPVVIATAIVPLLALRGPFVTPTTLAAGFAPFTVTFGILTVTSMLWFLFKAGPGRAVVGVATSVMAFAYIAGLGGYAGFLLQRKHGVQLIVGTLLCVVAYDTFGYFIGSKFGNAKIAPDISPNKTVEGTLGGVVGSVFVAIVVVHALSPWHDGTKVLQIAVFGFLIGVAALLGDLCESLLKRDLGVKDFGTMLPGHGGFLDRFDGLLFALPVAFYLTAHFNLF